MNYTDARTKDPELYNELIDKVIDAGFYETELITEADAITTGIIERDLGAKVSIIEGSNPPKYRIEVTE